MVFQRLYGVMGISFDPLCLQTCVLPSSERTLSARAMQRRKTKECVSGLVAREAKLRPEGRFYRLQIYHDEAVAGPIRGQSQAHVWKGLSGRTTIDLRKLMSVGMGGSWPEEKGHTWTE